MKNLTLSLILLLWLQSCNKNDQYSSDKMDEPVAVNGVSLKISKLEQYLKDDSLAFFNLPIEVSNVSKDTIYLRNIHFFNLQDSTSENITLHIVDQNENEKQKLDRSWEMFIDSVEKINLPTEYVSLLPDASLKVRLLLNLALDYKLDRGKTYSIYAEYKNTRLYPNSIIAMPLPSGKQLWTGVLKSNTYKFRF